MYLKFIPSTLTSKSIPPKNVSELELAMSNMDKSNGTSFKQWVLAEENIAYICSYKRGVFETNWKENPQSVIIVLQWLSKSWSVSSTAEFMLKMFFHWKLDSAKFGALINGLVNGLATFDTPHSFPEAWTKQKVYELLHVLLIGEDAASSARFIKNVTKQVSLIADFNGTQSAQSDAPDTKQWSRNEILELVKGLSYRLQWDAPFLRQLLVELSSHLITHPKRLSELVEEIKFKFNSQKRVQAHEYFPHGTQSPMSDHSILPQGSRDNYQSFQEHVLFSISMLDMILLEAECQELSGILNDLTMLGMAGWENPTLRTEALLRMKNYNHIPKSDSKMELSEVEDICQLEE